MQLVKVGRNGGDLRGRSSRRVFQSKPFTSQKLWRSPFIACRAPARLCSISYAALALATSPAKCEAFAWVARTSLFNFANNGSIRFVLRRRGSNARSALARD